MTKSETKTIVTALFLFAAAFFVLPNFSVANEYSSSNFTVKDPVIDSGSQNSSSANYGLGQSLSQIAIGKSTSTNFQLWSGFQYFFKVNQNTLTATPDDGEVDLSWTVPQTFLGANVAGYEVGTGTTSGSYTFQNVGNVTSYTVTGLTNGTTYYFIIKAYATGGTFLVYSNEASAAPNGSITPPPPPPSGGGGSQTSYGNIILSGKAYPDAIVTILRDSVIVGTVNANSSGDFSFTQNNITAGNYTYTLYAIDQNGIKSSNLTLQKTIVGSITTTVSNLIVPPTINASHTSVKQAESLTISGYSAPNSSVVLSFGGARGFNTTVTSNASGYYSHVLNTDNRPKGSYSVYAVTNLGALSSPQSSLVFFIIGDRTETTPPDQCKRSDLNCDGKVELIDFSILLYFWEATDLSRNPRVDIDKSGNVGLRDLSIMLYDWTG